MPSPQNRTLWRRLISVQEIGLLAVIALLMLGMTIYGAIKPKPATITREVASEAMVVLNAEKDIAVTHNGATRTYLSEDGWTWNERARVLRQKTMVNRFFEQENLVQLTNSAAFIAVMAIGMTAIIVLAGIDLSIGSIYAVSAMLGAMILGAVFDQGTSAWVAVPAAILICCLIGAMCGLLNGVMIVGLKVHPFIITLGTMAIFRGIVFVASGGQTESQFPTSLQTDFFKLNMAGSSGGGVYPVPTIIMAIVAIAGTFMLARTVFGRRIYAIGGNETAAHYAGIPVGKVKIWAYTLCGLLAGLSACMYIGYYGASESNAGDGYELDVIAAAVIGGAALSGGRGSAIGAALGAILVKLINNAMLIFELDQSYNQIVMGSAIILAVVVDQLKSRFIRS